MSNRARSGRRPPRENSLGRSTGRSRRGSKGGPSLAGLFGRLIFWAPVWLPLVVVFQLTLGGLKPTRAEGERVRDAEQEVLQRVDALEAERVDLERRRRMLNDPIYRARVERTRLRPERGALTLDTARELESHGDKE